MQNPASSPVFAFTKDLVAANLGSSNASRAACANAAHNAFIRTETVVSQFST